MRPPILNRTRGQGTAEYAIILALTVLVVVLILGVLGVNLKEVSCKVVRGLGGSGSCGSYCQDTFNDLNGWSQLNPNSWSASSNQICVNGTGEQRVLNKCSQTSSVPADYVVSVDIATLFSGSGYGVYFRTQSVSPLNGYIFQYDPGLNGFVFRKWVNGAETQPIASNYQTGYSWYNQPRKIEVKVQGNTYTALVDGKQILQVSDATYPQGGAGLRSWDSTKACFSGFNVSPIP